MVDTLRRLAQGHSRSGCSRPDINLKLVMDQSVYVRQSIKALVQEGVPGGVLCSLVILLFLGEWRMTAIAVMTLPISILASLGVPVRRRATRST